MDAIINVLLILFLIFLNGFFVTAEYSLVAVRKTRIEELVRAGNSRAKSVKRALKRLNTYISATQIGITIASIALGWLGEPFVAVILRPFVAHSFISRIVSVETFDLIVSFCIVTFFDVVLGEIVPKAVALQKAEQLVLLCIFPLTIFATIFKPLIWLLNKTSAVILMIMGLKSTYEKKAVLSEEEVKMIITQSGEGGQIPPDEVEMVQNVFKLDDIAIRDVMIPRERVEALEATATLAHAIESIVDTQTSRLPIYKHSVDKIVGFVHVKDVYQAYLKLGGHVEVKHADIMREIIAVPPSRRADDVLVEMRRRRIHIAAIVDSHNKTLGIVTLEDVIESLVGEINDEFDLPRKRD